MMSKPEVIKTFRFASYLRPDLYENMGWLITFEADILSSIETKKMSFSVICEFKLDLKCLQYCYSSVVVTAQEGDGDSSLTDGPMLQTASAPAQSVPTATSCSLATQAPRPLASTVEPLLGGDSHTELSGITKGI